MDVPLVRLGCCLLREPSQLDQVTLYLAGMRINLTVLTLGYAGNPSSIVRKERNICWVFPGQWWVRNPYTVLFKGLHFRGAQA
jgi:hypothetical protein